MKKSLKKLVIDTAIKYFYLALLDGDNLIEEIYELSEKDHSQSLMPSIEKLLNNHDLKLRDLDEVIVGIGPGSYTGVRIGVVVGKMIAFLNNITCYSVSSLALIASSSKAKNVLAYIDARRGNGFLGVYSNDGMFHVVIDDTFKNFEEFKASLDFEYEVVSYGKPDILKILNSNLLTKIDNIHELVPNYLQLTEAERNKNDNKKA